MSTPTIPNYPPPSNADISGCDSVAEVDVAELYLKMSSPTMEDEDSHIVHIVTRQPLDIGQFKAMFYAGGDGQFSVANCYNNPRKAVSINKSVWGIPAVTDPSNLFLYNYNKLGGRNNNPPASFLAYVYENDRQRTFYAQEEVMSNIESDICEGRSNWSMCSRSGIFDSLYNLCFVREKFSSPCLNISCARTWNEVEDALAEFCICKNIGLEINDYIDFFVNIKLVNDNCCVKPTIIRIRFVVQITDGFADMTNWDALTLFHHPSTAVPLGNTETLFTQQMRMLFFSSYKERLGPGAISVPITAGQFYILDSSTPAVLNRTFSDASINIIVLSATTVNGEVATDSNWPDIYFDVSHNYLFERSINGYPNNYMICQYISQNNADYSNNNLNYLDFEWLQGAGDYELIADPSYSLNIYDMKSDCSILPSIPYDMPEGGTNQYSGASLVETDGSLSNLHRVQAPNSTAPSNLSSKVDPADIT